MSSALGAAGDLAPYTTDGDLAIDPRELDDEPALTSALKAAEFEHHRASRHLAHERGPGRYPRASIPGRSRPTRCSAGHSWERGRTEGHWPRSGGSRSSAFPCSSPRFRRHPGVRRFGRRRRGPLLVAKLHETAERKHAPDRLQDKDGLDVLRLLRFADTTHVAGTLTKLSADPIASEVTQRARTFLEALFGKRESLERRWPYARA